MKIFKKDYTPTYGQAIKGIEAFGNININRTQTWQSEEDAQFALGLDLEYQPGDGKTDPGVTWMKNMLELSEKDRIQFACVWDTETTDLTGYIVSIALELVDIWTGEVVMSEYQVIDPDYRISQDAIDIHKISQKEAEENLKFDKYWDKFKIFFEKADIMVGHNLGFDIAILERDLFRYGLEKPVYPPIFDTQTAVVKFVGAKNINNRIKKPNLSEIVEFLGIPKPEGEFHNAEVDVEMTRKVLVELVKSLARTV